MSEQIILFKKDTEDQYKKNLQKKARFFATIYSGPGELLSKMTQVKMKARRVN